jgi:hypothetical protein
MVRQEIKRVKFLIGERKAKLREKEPLFPSA